MNDLPIGRYRWPWAGAESGYDIPMYATSYYYNIRRAYNTLHHNIVQILIKDIFGERWINVTKDDLLPLE